MKNKPNDVALYLRSNQSIRNSKIVYSIALMKAISYYSKDWKFLSISFDYKSFKFLIIINVRCKHCQPYFPYTFHFCRHSSKPITSLNVGNIYFFHFRGNVCIVLKALLFFQIVVYENTKWRVTQAVAFTSFIKGIKSSQWKYIMTKSCMFAWENKTNIFFI